MVIRHPFRPFPPSRKTKAALVFVLALAALLALFDWNWFRHPLERYLTERSGREVRAEDMRVELGFRLEPTVRFRGVYIENAPWAEKRPLATIGELSVTFSLASLWQDRTVISRLVILDGDVDMERQADGLRNWRLRHPDDRGPGKVKVLTLEAQRTRLRFVNRGIGLDFVAIASPSNDERLTTRISYEGSYRGKDFKGEALTAGLMSIRESGIGFPLRGHIVSRETRLDFDGSFTDVFDIGPMAAKVRLAGPSLSQLSPFLRMQPPPSRPYAFEAQLTHKSKVFTFARLHGNIGGSALTGDASYDRSASRPVLQAALHSESATFDDIGPLAGMRSGPSIERAQKKSQDTGNNSADLTPELDDKRLFPTSPFRTESLRAFDARLKVSAARFSAPAVPMLESLSIEAVLDNGVLEVKPDIGVAGGRAVGSVAFNARTTPPSMIATMEVRDVRLERLVPQWSAKRHSVGALRGHLKLSGGGDSVEGMLGNATGTVDASLLGGQISNLADAKLSLNFGKAIGALIHGERDITIGCGEIAFDFRDGVGKSRLIVLDTEQTHIDGKGTIDLRRERMDLLLTPEPKQPSLFTRRVSIGVRGPLRAPAVSIEPRGEQERVLPKRCSSS